MGLQAHWAKIGPHFRTPLFCTIGAAAKDQESILNGMRDPLYVSTNEYLLNNTPLLLALLPRD